ncbi:MAG TPA: hypothetical protein PLP42_19710, partial [Acidobacteriota bacterium]|nr:hypothetical protein [Acidobacteriota bacterium]
MSIKQDNGHSQPPLRAELASTTVRLASDRLRRGWWLSDSPFFGELYRNPAPRLNRSGRFRLLLDRGPESTGFRYNAEKHVTQPPCSPGPLPAPSTTGIRIRSIW